MSIRLDSESGYGKILLNWWQGLDDDRASRATLRRADSILTISMTPAFRQIYQRLRVVALAQASEHGNARDNDWNNEWDKPWIQDALAVAIATLAHVPRHQDAARFAEVISLAPAGEKPPVSPLRFQRLLESPDLSSLLSGLRRVLPLLGKERGLDILLLASDILYWNDKVRRDWAYAYVWPAK